MFQDDALFPHRDVGRQRRLRPVGMTASRPSVRRVAELLELVGLAGLERRPVGNAVGRRAQRVALARALAPQPRVLLLDEPLGALDRPAARPPARRAGELFAQLGLTVIYVTHDVGEAFALGRRVAVMRDGRVVAGRGRPTSSGRRPADAWVARFLGMRNVIERGGRLAVDAPRPCSFGRARAPRPRQRSAAARWCCSRCGATTVSSSRPQRQRSTLHAPATACRSPSTSKGSSTCPLSDTVVIRRRIVVHGRVQGVWFRESGRLAGATP